MRKQRLFCGERSNYPRKVEDTVRISIVTNRQPLRWESSVVGILSITLEGDYVSDPNPLHFEYDKCRRISSIAQALSPEYAYVIGLLTCAQSRGLIDAKTLDTSWGIYDNAHPSTH